MFCIVNENSKLSNHVRIEKIYKLRHKDFVEILGWVKGSNGLEVGEFDSLCSGHLTCVDADGDVLAYVWLFSPIGPYMLKGAFYYLLGRAVALSSPRVFEISRFCVGSKKILVKRTAPIKAVAVRLLASRSCQTELVERTARLN